MSFLPRGVNFFPINREQGSHFLPLNPHVSSHRSHAEAAHSSRSSPSPEMGGSDVDKGGERERKPGSKSFCIIVARYNENIEWTKQFKNVLIYNKGNKLDDGYNEFFLKNVGREGHTYYKYICDNYENLADFTIFLQGRPFDHSPNIINNTNKYLNNKELAVDFEFLSEDIHYSSLDLECNRYWQCQNIHKSWERVFGINSGNHECIFGAGAQFIVSKNKILQNPKKFYENIVNMLEYSIDPLEGYDIERFHKYIFN